MDDARWQTKRQRQEPRLVFGSQKRGNAARGQLLLRKRPVFFAQKVDQCRPFGQEELFGFFSRHALHLGFIFGRQFQDQKVRRLDRGR